MRILSLSDNPVTFIYSPAIRSRFKGVDVIIGCGDLPYYYLEYVLDALEAPVFFVRGNHDKPVEYSTAGERSAPHGAIDLHRRVIRYQEVLIAGVQGSARYKPGPFQYSQGEMWNHVLSLAPRLMLNRLLYGRCLDVFVTHSPPTGVHDADDFPHRGVNAFRWLDTVFQPAVHLHGHIHIYSPDQPAETCLGRTRVVNAFGFREVNLVRNLNGRSAKAPGSHAGDR